MRRPLRRLAEVSAGSESETPFGGRSVTWEPVCVAWLAVVSEQPDEARDGEEPPRERRRLTAETRADPRLARGQRVELDGVAWRLAHVLAEAPRPGRMTLSLERES